MLRMKWQLDDKGSLFATWEQSDAVNSVAQLLERQVMTIRPYLDLQTTAPCEGVLLSTQNLRA